MKVSLFTALLYAASFVVAAPPNAIQDLAVRNLNPLEPYSALEKRKGGGGGKGGGSSSSGSGGKSGSSSSSGSGSGSFSFSSTSNTGGKTREGSGSLPAYGTRYAGGATVPYTAGARSPALGITPFLLPVGALLIFPGVWHYGLWGYPYSYPYYYNSHGRNTTSNVTCVCEQYSECGCDPDGNSTFLNQMVGNGTDAPVNTSLVRTVDYGNGSASTYINGTLDNGTTAPGGTDPSNEDEANGGVRLVSMYGGYWVMIATVIAGVTLL